jgi:hypothetical protein
VLLKCDDAMRDSSTSLRGKQRGDHVCKIGGVSVRSFGAVFWCGCFMCVMSIVCAHLSCVGVSYLFQCSK